MNMLIVESNAKARTIQKYLGKEWVVLATGGHVQELPERKHDPKQGKKAYWASRPGELPKPPWVWTDNGDKALDRILKAAEKQGTTRFFLATDPDREGEFIAWRLAEILADRGETQRVTFQEVTREAILEALAHPRAVDMDLVESAMVRRFLDRLVGFKTSKKAKSYVRGGAASMGRVQTPALGFVVERELEREAHVPIPFFEVSARVDDLDLQVRFHEADDPDAWREAKKDGTEVFHATRTSDEALATTAYAALLAAPTVTLTDVQRRDRALKPKPAFTTDALLQAAGGRWGWSPKRTMAVANSLYEAGHITYIRTDSTRLADKAIEEARAVIEATWDAGHLGPGATGAPPKGKVQDAHEAIRPTRPEVTVPPDVDDDAERLYALVRAQLLASQMASAQRATASVTARVEGLERPLTGAISWYLALGWRAAFADLDDAPRVAAPTGATVGATLPLLPAGPEEANPELKRGETQPPARYRAHTLVKAMKDHGIGRPSTYAATVETLLKRTYVEEDKGALAPTDRGRVVWQQVAPMYALPDGAPLFDTGYTAAMEDRLDAVAAGEEGAADAWVDLRDRVLAADAEARAQRRAGTATPAQLARLRALCDSADDAPECAGDLERLTFEEASARITALLERGVAPAPSERQLNEIRRLLTAAAALEADALAPFGVTRVEDVATGPLASEIIDGLKGSLPDIAPATEKQLRFAADLAKKQGLTEAEACALVGGETFESLTGGRSGSASKLITALKKRTRQEAKA